MPGTDLKVVNLPDESDMWVRLLSVMDDELSARDFYPPTCFRAPVGD